MGQWANGESGALLAYSPIGLFAYSPIGPFAYWPIVTSLMRIYVIVTVFCVIAAGALAQDHLATLGISEGRAREAVFDSLMADQVSLAGKPAAFIALSPQGRVALVNFALTLARGFVESDDFKRRYADHREANGPDPLPEAQTADRNGSPRTTAGTPPSKATSRPAPCSVNGFTSKACRARCTPKAVA